MAKKKTDPLQLADEASRAFNKVVRGELRPEDAWKAHSHLIIEEVAEKFGWEYRRVMPNEK